jgi:hypothetical protein
MAQQQLETPVEFYLRESKHFLENEQIDQRIKSKFKMFVGADHDLTKTVYAEQVRTALRAIAEVITVSAQAGIKPAMMRRMKAYTVVVDNLRGFMQDVAMLKLGADVNYAFALERGFEELLAHECKALHDEGKVGCKIRFVRPRDLRYDGQYSLYERITVRFDGQFEVSFIDGARYGA